MAEKNYDPQHQWDTFWKKLCTDKDGNVDLEQIKKELSDYKFVIDNAPAVYSEASGNKTANIMVHENTMISLIYENIDKRIENSFEMMIDDIKLYKDLEEDVGKENIEKFIQFVKIYANI